MSGRSLVEEFMQMLLSFPLDPSPAVIEIISDSIYANSSTLDGRRFAAEFCQKRKADAAAARTKAGSASGAKAPRVSLADGEPIYLFDHELLN